MNINGTYEISDVFSDLIHPLGTTYRDANGNEYIFLKGVADTAANSWVSFDEAHTTALLVTGAKGRVGLAMSASVADKYGWYQIYGSATGKVATGFADNGLVYATAVAGTVDDAVVEDNLVVGAIGRSAIASGVATMELSYPFITNALG